MNKLPMSIWSYWCSNISIVSENIPHRFEPVWFNSTANQITIDVRPKSWLCSHQTFTPIKKMPIQLFSTTSYPSLFIWQTNMKFDSIACFGSPTFTRDSFNRHPKFPHTTKKKRRIKNGVCIFCNWQKMGSSSKRQHRQHHDLWPAQSNGPGLRWGRNKVWIISPHILPFSHSNWDAAPPH